jgi:hypothetical protein
MTSAFESQLYLTEPSLFGEAGSSNGTCCIGTRLNATTLPEPSNAKIGISFGGLPPRSHKNSGTPSPADKADKAQVDWKQVEQQAPRDAQGNKIYRFSDIHCHMHNYTGKGCRPEDVVEAAIKLGIKRFTWMPIPTTLISVRDDRQRYELYKLSHHCGEHYYVPDVMANIEDLSPDTLRKIQKTVELDVDRSIDDKLMHHISSALLGGRILPEHLDMIDLAITGIHLGDPRVTCDILDKLWRVGRENKHLQEALADTSDADAPGKATAGERTAMMGPRLRFTHIGEVTLRKELVETLFAGKSQADLKKNIAPCREAMRLAGVIGMPWILHCDVDKPEGLKSSREKNKPPVHLEDIKKLMRSCPNTEIIWAHAGGLGRFVKAGPYHLAELRDFMLDPTLMHVKLDISWSQVANQINKDETTTESWAKLLCEFEQRILFGSDALAPQTAGKWTETHDIYKEKLLPEMEKIKPGAARKILLDNYDEVMLNARARVDVFIDHVIPEIIDDVHHIAGPEYIDVRAIQRERDRLYQQRKHQDDRLQAVIDHFKRIEIELPPTDPGDMPRIQTMSEDDMEEVVHDGSNSS